MLFRCRDCRRDLPAEAFANRKDGKRGICKACNAARCKAWRAGNPEYWKQITGEPGSVTRARYYDRRRRKFVRTPYSFLRELLTRIMHDKHTQRAKMVKAITHEDLCTLWDTQGGLYAITGLQMAHERHNLRSVSIDRIDSTQGYVLSNIHLVCRFINLAKQQHPLADIRSALDDYFELRKARELSCHSQDNQILSETGHEYQNEERT